MPLFGYSAFGLSLAASCPLPGLAAASSASPADVRIHLGTMPPDWKRLQADALREAPWRITPPAAPNEPPILTVWRLDEGRYYYFSYYDETRFLVLGTADEIWATWHESATLADTATYLLGPVLGFTLRLRGVLCLHAGAIRMGERAFALVGPAGAGKSTLTAAFARRGELILADDIVALHPAGNTFLIQPAYPQLRLWPDSARRLYGDENALPRLTPTWDKRGVDLTQAGYRFAHQPAPLAAIYFLGARQALAPPHVEEAPPAGRLPTLAANTYANYLLDRELRTAEFAALGRLAATTPLRLVVPHEDLAQLEQLCDAIVADFQRVGS